MDFTMSRDESGGVATFGATPDRAWSAIWAAYQTLELAPTTVQQQQRLIGRDGLEVNGSRVAGLRVTEVVSCGTSPAGAPLAQTYAVRLSITSTVATAASGATLTTRVLGSATDRAVAGPPGSGGSTGRLETRLARLVSEQLKR